MDESHSRGTGGELMIPPQSRDLNALDPRFRGLFDAYLSELGRRLTGVNIIVTETARTKERQEWLKADGKSKTLHSNHLLGRAIDIALQDKTTGG